MNFVPASGLRESEAAAIADHPGLGLEMMTRAGKGLAGLLARWLRQLEPPHPAVRFLAGPGNNGGDAFAAAAVLDAMGIAAEVWLAVPADKLRGDARAAFDRLAARNVPVREIAEGQWEGAGQDAPDPAILVDALLGTGAKGEPRGTIRQAVEYLGRMTDRCLIVAADIPTGMDAETGETAACHVRADFTVTMECPKAGMAAPEAIESLGSLWCVPVGLPAEAIAAVPDARPDLQWISYGDVRRAFPRRARASHKGTYGTAGLIGGSAAYPGAIALAAEGAIRSGAGLVRVMTSSEAAGGVLARVPEAIVAGGLSADVDFGGLEAILAGPGLGRDPETRRLVARLLREATCPLVLDADAIAVLAGKPEAIQGSASPVILTPHPGELALLLGTDTAAIQRDRQAAAREAADRTGAIVVLKGAGTLVARAGEPAWLNLTGNPGMACGGSGDVLAGLLAGGLAQGADPFQAACAAVWLHGTAGDIAALRQTQAAMKAGDLSECLPEAFRMSRIIG
jgi:NAD(P)H-hydrate epimerase